MMSRPLTTVDKKVTYPSVILEYAAMYFVEVSSNVYHVKKHRTASATNRYVDGRELAQELNTGFNLALERLDGTLLVNFNHKPYHQYLSDRNLNREL